METKYSDTRLCPMNSTVPAEMTKKTARPIPTQAPTGNPETSFLVFGSAGIGATVGEIVVIASAARKGAGLCEELGSPLMLKIQSTDEMRRFRSI
jgi:hypothetical protein